jgi:hypothetical protein
MIKIHKLEDGDIIKILPFIDKDDKITWCKDYTCAVIDKQSIYDNSDKQYLRKISHTLYRNDGDKKLTVQIRYAYNIYIRGEIKIMNVSRTLCKVPIFDIQDIISNNPDVLDIRSNHQLFVVKDEVSAGGQFFPDWKKSYVSEKSWTPPVNDINSKDEWYSYIKTNQPDFHNHIESNNIFVHKEKLVKYLGTDMLGDLISDDRQKKLDELGI